MRLRSGCIQESRKEENNNEKKKEKHEEKIKYRMCVFVINKEVCSIMRTNELSRAENTHTYTHTLHI